jgi:hypothetical protein
LRAGFFPACSASSLQSSSGIWFRELRLPVGATNGVWASRSRFSRAWRPGYRGTGGQYPFLPCAVGGIAGAVLNQVSGALPSPITHSLSELPQPAHRFCQSRPRRGVGSDAPLRRPMSKPIPTYAHISNLRSRPRAIGRPIGSGVATRRAICPGYCRNELFGILFPLILPAAPKARTSLRD